MLNNVKDFLISKKEAFEVGYSPIVIHETLQHTLIGCAIGATLALLNGAIVAAHTIIKDGEFMLTIRKASEELKNQL